MTQTVRLMKLLRHNQMFGVTPLMALAEIGSMRLAARIFDLRREGHDIRMTVVEGNGKRYARYVLREAPEQLTIDQAIEGTGR